MSDRLRSDSIHNPKADVSRDFPPLPTWIARRLLKEGEQVTWVRGPAHNPEWERYITHPLLFVVALALGVLCMVGGATSAGSVKDMPIPAALFAIFLVLGSVFVLGLANAHFTRLVVTNSRLVILQGYEVCRTWRVERLPRSLVRFGPSTFDGEISRTVDLEALNSILGGSTDTFASSKSILALGKHVEQITQREKDGR
jgi:hypothetical protein